MKNKIVLRSAFRHRIFITGLLFLIVCSCVVFVLFFGKNENARAAVTGDYRSKASGTWTTAANWEKYNGSDWVTATTAPVQSDKQITILSGHTVTIAAALSIDEIVIDAGGVLSLNSGITLSLKKLAIPDMKIYGTFRNAGVVSIAGGTSLTYYSGGTYQHNYTTTAGTIPLGIWNTGSVCEVIGYTTNTLMPDGLEQPFTDFKWNCVSQTAHVNFTEDLTDFTGNFIVASTGTKELQLANNGFTFNVIGNISVTGGALVFNIAANKTTVLNQTGNIIISGGTVSFTSGATAIGTINLTGNYSQTGGVFNFATGLNSTTTLKVSGDFTHTGGTLTTSGSGATGNIIFNKAGSQTFTAYGNTVSGNVDYTINSGSTLNTGTSAMIGRNFTLAAGGTIGIGSPDGISASGATGNMQVSGTRTYNAGGYFLFNGNTFQVTGNGLPSTIGNLTINNSSYVTLTNSLAISNILALQNGKIITGSNELHLTNTSSGAITGNSDNSFVVGNLRRTITSSGTFSFPVGSLVKYELMNVTLSATSGFTSMLGAFVGAPTNDTINPMTAVVNGVDMSEMLDYGYWTLQPNSPLSAGTYTIQINEQGFTNVLSNGTFYSLLVRNNSTSAWESVGIHNDNTQSVNGNTVTAARSGMTSFHQYGIGLGDFLSFSSALLISGTAGNVGAVYLFSDVMRGIDAWMEIVYLYNGATLNDVDNSTTGYNESFQPFVNFPPKKDSYIEWRITFKKANTSTDTTLKKITATGVDVDGGYSDVNNNIREYIVATMPTSYSLDPSSDITMSSDSGRYKALGPNYSIANIDTSHHELMYQLNYNNVNTLLYRTGAINNYSTTQVRQTSLYFRTFLMGSPVYALPITLVDFNAIAGKDKVILNWVTSSEINNDFFTIERSDNGKNFSPVLMKEGAGNSTSMRYYEIIDNNPLQGISYYRLKQTDFDGKFTYSNIESVYFNVDNKNDLEILSMSPNPFDTDIEINFFVKDDGDAELTMFDASGKTIERKTITVNEGVNKLRLPENEILRAGIYFVSIVYENYRVTKKIVRR